MASSFDVTDDFCEINGKIESVFENIKNDLTELFDSTFLPEFVTIPPPTSLQKDNELSEHFYSHSYGFRDHFTESNEVGNYRNCFNLAGRGICNSYHPRSELFNQNKSFPDSDSNLNASNNPRISSIPNIYWKTLSSSIRADLDSIFNTPSVEIETSPIVPTQKGFNIYEVTFKRNTSDFILHSRVTVPIVLDEIVIVSAERGCEDLGTVTRIVDISQWMAENNIVIDAKKPFNINKHTKKIVRIATASERRKLVMKATDEANLQQYCQQVATSQFRLAVTIVDVDFQFDRRKVTVYYTTPLPRVDFRELVTHLNEVYNTRTWMVDITLKYSNSCVSK